MNKEIPQFLIAAPCSGSGKTTICRGLMAALTRRGLRVQPYKCGPDYIDTTFHHAVCGHPSVNLDLFMASPIHIRQLYSYYSTDADVCIVEGMMGLFDGYQRMEGSSAAISETLHIPVILVVDARSAAYSIAALLKGFTQFRRETKIVGVLFNQVGSPYHYQLLQEACEEFSLPCLGYLPKEPTLEQKSRYLGLDFSQPVHATQLDRLVQLIEEHIDVQRLLELTSRPWHPDSSPFSSHPYTGWHTVVLRDKEAFSFIYTEHLDILSKQGKVTFLDPASNQPLPPDTDLLYLPGGYPEKHAETLSRATITQTSIRSYLEAGGRALAECGGMIYLTEGIHQDEKTSFVPFCGFLPCSISQRQQDRKLSLGYRQCHYNGQELRGHEFHYTQFYGVADTDRPVSATTFYNARRQPVSTPLFRQQNLIASYTHLYWGETNITRLFDTKTE